MFYFIFFYLRFDILHYNSCENDDEEFYKPVTLILKQLVKENYKWNCNNIKTEVENVDVPKQPRDSVDCGVYCIKYAQAIMMNDKSMMLELASRDIKIIRRELVCIVKENTELKHPVPN